MKPIDEPHGHCSVDPISLTGLALGALAGGGTALGASALAGGGTQTPAAAPAAPPTTVAQPVNQPTGQAPAPKSQTPTFLSAAATPAPVQSGQKSLLGQ